MKERATSHNSRTTYHRPNRTLRSSELRALDWVRSHELKAVKKDRKSGVKARTSGSLAVMRSLEVSTPDGILANEGIRSLLTSTRGAKAHSKYSTSLLGWRECRAILSRVGGNLLDTKQRLEDIVAGFPSTREGRVGRAVVLGPRTNGRGREQFIGYSFDPDTTDALLAERSELIDGLEGIDIKAAGTVMPHIALFSTSNRHLALELRDRLDELNAHGMSVELGVPEVVPATGMNRNFPTHG